jgi:hypothetical protein
MINVYGYIRHGEPLFSGYDDPNRIHKSGMITAFLDPCSFWYTDGIEKTRLKKLMKVFGTIEKSIEHRMNLAYCSTGMKFDMSPIQQAREWGWLKEYEE